MTYTGYKKTIKYGWSLSAASITMHLEVSWSVIIVYQDTLSCIITYIYSLHTFMLFKHLDQIAAFLQDFLLSHSFAHPKVSQGGEGKTSHLFPRFTICKQNSYQTWHASKNESTLVMYIWLHLFRLLPSGRGYNLPRCSTNRLKNSRVPAAVGLSNNIR